MRDVDTINEKTRFSDVSIIFKLLSSSDICARQDDIQIKLIKKQKAYGCLNANQNHVLFKK